MSEISTPTFTPEQVVALLREAVERAGSTAAYAKAQGWGRNGEALVSLTINGHRIPGATIAAALGLRVVRRYELQP